MPRVAINIITWNSQDTIEACLDSIFTQTHRDYSVTVVDNASQDGSVALVQKYQNIKLIQNATNEGYAPGHNTAIDSTDSEFVLNLNPDVILMPMYVEQMLNAIQEQPSYGMAAGKLLAISPEHFHNKAFAEACLIDSAGLIMYRNRRQFLRGHLQHADSFSAPALIFGADGAAPLYRRAMLNDVRIDGEYFDALFRSHKEDVDLAWRAQLLGWQSIYAPHAIAYHIRSFRPGKRQKLPAQIRRDAVKNRWLMNIKNELPTLFWRDFPRIAVYELRILGYLLLLEQSSLPAIGDTLRLLPRTLQRRRIIQQRRKQDSAYMRQWFE